MIALPAILDETVANGKNQTPDYGLTDQLTHVFYYHPMVQFKALHCVQLQILEAAANRRARF